MTKAAAASGVTWYWPKWPSTPTEPDRGRRPGRLSPATGRHPGHGRHHFPPEAVKAVAARLSIRPAPASTASRWRVLASSKERGWATRGAGHCAGAGVPGFRPDLHRRGEPTTAACSSSGSRQARPSAPPVWKGFAGPHAGGGPAERAGRGLGGGQLHAPLATAWALALSSKSAYSPKTTTAPTYVELAIEPAGNLRY